MINAIVVRRDTLLRAARKGKLVAKCTGHYTDDYAFDAAYNFGRSETYLPVYVLGEDEPRNAAPEGHVVLWAHEFKGRSGGAWRVMDRDPEVIHFNVHSNKHFEMKVVK